MQETIARRGIRKVVHLHCDHWESDAVSKLHGSAADMRLWMQRCLPARPTLFARAPTCYTLDKQEARWQTPDDDLGWKLSSRADIVAGYVRTAQDCGAEFQIHVHHEPYTVNTLPDDKLSPWQAAIRKYVLEKNCPLADHRRFEADTRAHLEWFGEVLGKPLGEWYFVHGCWAFGASDPEICQLQSELPLLYSLGCRGDFSFPAGRRYCDPGWDGPRWVVPVPGSRAFEAPAADPQKSYSPGRMLVWASPTDHWWCGLDAYTESSRSLTELPDNVERYLKLCPVVNGVAYVKTCAHQMHPHYWPAADDPRPTLGAFARGLQEKSEAAGVPVEFATASEVVAMLK